MEKLQRTAAQTAVLMAILTLGSKLLGFIREMVMANFFGTSYITDAYVMAIAIPGMIFGGLFGAVATAYMPLFSEEVELNGEKAGNVLTTTIVNFLLIVSIVSAVFGFVFSENLVHFLASGFSGKTEALTVYFTRVTFSYVIFSAIAGIFEAYLQYRNVFLPQILVGYAQNIIVIIGVIISARNDPKYLAYGYLFSYGFLFLMNYKIAKKRKYVYIRDVNKNKTWLKIIPMAFPVFIGSSAMQINTFIDKVLASNLIEGSIAALNYANLVVGSIMGLTTAIMSTIIYPKLSQALALNNRSRFSDMLKVATNVILIIIIPFTVGSYFYSNEIIEVIFERGAFGLVAKQMTSSAFVFYAVGLPFLSLNVIMTRAYYAYQDTKLPLKLTAISILANALLSIILVKVLSHNGLALATSLSYVLNTFLLYGGINYKYPEVNVIESSKKTFQIIGASICIVLISRAIYFGLTVAFGLHMIIGLIIAITLAAGIYVLILLRLKISEIELLKSIFLKKRIEND